MSFLKPYIDALLKVWHDNSPAARIAILLLATLCTVAIVGVGYWSVQPSYVVLVSETESDKVDKVIDSLDKEGIEYQLSGAGGNLLVDKRDYAKARLLARSNGISGEGTSSSDASFGSAFGSPTERRNFARIQKQQSLAGTIKKISIIEQADVHLNIPDRGPFERKKSIPSASVLLTLRPGERLSEQQATSIASLVAYAVEDLTPERVQITDKDGNSYSTPDESTHQINSQVEYTNEAESKLAKKAETQLLKFLGYGNASVQVSLDLTFTNGQRTTTTYDKEGKVPNEEDLVSETTTNAQPQATGAAGIAENLQSRTKSKSSVQSKTENIKTSYLVGMTEETEANTTPVRNYMTVSVLVNSGAEGVSNEDGTLAVGMDKRVEAIVKNAVGFKEDSDTISVEFLTFPDSEFSTEPIATPFDWSRVTSIVENASLAIAAGFAFLMGWLMLRRFQPSQDRGGSGGAANEQERTANVHQLSDLIKQNPEVFTRIVQSWSGSEQNDPAEQKEAA